MCRCMMGVSQKFWQVLLFGQKWFKCLQLFVPKFHIFLKQIFSTKWQIPCIGTDLFLCWIKSGCLFGAIFTNPGPGRTDGGTKAPLAVRHFSSVFPIAFCLSLLNPDHLQFQNVCPLFSRWYVTTQYDILVCQCTHYPLHCVKCLLLLCAMSNIIGLKKILPDKK